MVGFGPFPTALSGPYCEGEWWFIRCDQKCIIGDCRSAFNRVNLEVEDFVCVNISISKKERRRGLGWGYYLNLSLRG